jgi:hypothetical protein
MRCYDGRHAASVRLVSAEDQTLARSLVGGVTSGAR